MPGGQAPRRCDQRTTPVRHAYVRLRCICIAPSSVASRRSWLLPLEGTRYTWVCQMKMISLFKGSRSLRLFNFSVPASIACCRARVPPSRGADRVHGGRRRPRSLRDALLPSSCGCSWSKLCRALRRLWLCAAVRLVSRCCALLPPWLKRASSSWSRPRSSTSFAQVGHGKGFQRGVQ